MHVSPSPFLARLPLPATATWPQGVRDIEAMAHGSMSVILFAPCDRDHQTSHDQDELYVVIAGHGVLVVGDDRTPFATGDVLFVAAHRVHRFEAFSDDFATWAIFWGPKGGEDPVAHVDQQS